MDIEKEPLHPTSHSDATTVDMPPKSALNEDHIDLRVGQEPRSHHRGCRLLSRGLKGIAVFLIALLAANGFWALVRPELYDHNGFLSLKGLTSSHHHKHHRHHGHHKPDHRPHPGPPGRGPEHPHPPPPPPHEPGHGPGGDRPGPPHPHPRPPPPPHGGPGKPQECFDLQPGKVLEIREQLEWFGQSVRVAPSLAGSSVTFVWDGEVGPPAPPRGGPHGPPGSHPGPPRPPREDNNTDRDDVDEEKDEKKKPKEKVGDVVYEVRVPNKADWKDADISSQDLKICTVRRFDSTGLDIFNASGIPPSHARIDPAFHQVAPLFNTTVRLPSHYARTAIRAGHFP